MNLGVLASHEGTTLQGLFDAFAGGRIPGRVSVVVSNNGDSGALVKARQVGVRAVHLSSRTHRDPATLDQADGDEHDRIVQIADRTLGDNLVEPHAQCETSEEARDDGQDRRLHRSVDDAPATGTERHTDATFFESARHRVRVAVQYGIRTSVRHDAAECRCGLPEGLKAVAVVGLPFAFHLRCAVTCRSHALIRRRMRCHGLHRRSLHVEVNRRAVR
jgi:hypothetical protein